MYTTLSINYVPRKSREHHVLPTSLGGPKDVLSWFYEAKKPPSDIVLTLYECYITKIVSIAQEVDHTKEGIRIT